VPFTRIEIRRGKPPEYREALLDVVYTTLRETMNVPDGDRFQVLTEHEPENLDISRDYLGIERSAEAIVIQITLNAGRSVEMKKAFYAALTAALQERIGIRSEDVTVSLVEVAKENWSFGNGLAPYA
jgi:phenylpyruvate tautomerase PptA (4-oxalocrotonate tautomerase family)